MVTKPEIAPLPNQSTAIIAALILVPIAIACVAAFVAIKTTDIWCATKEWAASSPLTSWCACHWRRKKEKDSSEVLSSQDSFCDLESVHSPGQKVDKPPEGLESKDTPTKVWHPDRSARLAWSFGQTGTRMSPSPVPCASSNVQMPLPVVVSAPVRGTSISQDDNPLYQGPPSVRHHKVRFSI